MSFQEDANGGLRCPRVVLLTHVSSNCKETVAHYVADVFENKIEYSRSNFFEIFVFRVDIFFPAPLKFIALVDDPWTIFDVDHLVTWEQALRDSR